MSPSLFPLSSPPLPLPFAFPTPPPPSHPLSLPLTLSSAHFLPSILLALLSPCATGEGRTQQGDPGVAMVPSICITRRPASAPLENHPPQSFPAVEVAACPTGWAIRTRDCIQDGHKGSLKLLQPPLGRVPRKFSFRLSYLRRKTSRSQ